MPITITDLPNAILQQILSCLTYEELSAVSTTSPRFLYLSNIGFNIGVEKTLAILVKRLCWIEASINQNVNLEINVLLNRSYTILEMVGLEIHSFHMKNLHPNDSQFGRFLDKINAIIKIMNINNLPLLSRQSIKLQNALTKFNMQKTSLSQRVFNLPLGVHFMELLDLSMELGYDITCIYNLHDHTCSIFAKYHTDRIKFLLLSPDISYLTECTGRKIDLNEAESILRYLSFLINMYNCMFCKSQEYMRELRLREGNVWIANELNSLLTRRCSSRKVFNSVVVETYRKCLQQNCNKNTTGFLSCEIYLKCNLSEAPYQIRKNYEFLINDLSLECNDDEKRDVSTYGVEVKLRLKFHKCEDYEVIFREGF